jgi:hypothetical protein
MSSLVLLGIFVFAAMLYASLVPRRRDWISVALGAFGLVVMAIAVAIYTSDPGWATGLLGIWPMGYVWISLAALVLGVKILDRRTERTESYGIAFSLVFLAWTMTTITAFLLITVGHGVTEEYDDKLVLAIYTLGPTQLGFAGILEKGLVGSAMGRRAWAFAVLVGCIVLFNSLIFSVFLAW